MRMFSRRSLVSCTRSGHEVLLNKHTFSAWLSPVVFDQATSVCALSCTAVVFCLEDADVLTYCLDSERVDGGICTCKSLSLLVFGSLLFWHYKLSPVLREWGSGRWNRFWWARSVLEVLTKCTKLRSGLESGFPIFLATRYSLCCFGHLFKSKRRSLVSPH